LSTHLQLDDIGAGRKWILIDPKAWRRRVRREVATIMQSIPKCVGPSESSDVYTNPIRSKMDWFWAAMPSTGMAVCKGVLGTNVAVGTKDRVCAMKGALPVAVGPGHSSGDVWKYCGTSDVEQEQSSPNRFRPGSPT